jgi:2-succinyl-5-enolpyruvyl-6-hydroxy-3-cyclohexene-1-carboxylate synthase
VSESSVAPNVGVTFAATLVDEWVRLGLTDAVIAPGSRSTPMAVALAEHPGVRVHVQIDERSAGFMALGLGRRHQRPVVALTTSGTAAVELHPAVVEAHHGCVPLVAVTADRPPELRGVGAPQTIDQAGLFAAAIRWECDPGPPDAAAAPTWREIARDCWRAATAAVPGPVHLNLPFREPLLGPPGALSEPLPDAADAGVVTFVPAGVAETARIAERCTGRRGVLICGDRAVRAPEDRSAIRALAAVLGWPIVADHLSGLRDGSAEVIERADGFLRVPAIAEALAPEIVLHIGASLASRVVGEWLASSGAEHIGVDRWGQIPDPAGVIDQRVAGEVGAFCDGVARLVGPGAAPDWLETWRQVERTTRSAQERTLAAWSQVTEPGAVRGALTAVPEGGALVVSSSMPIRDLEWFAPGRSDVSVFANRGVNGIDGVLSTAVGIALGGGPVVCVTGDLAFLHDLGGLVGLSRRGVDLAIVVVDNDGGGIFSFLPQAQMLPPDLFEELCSTPHGLDLAAVSQALGLPATTVTTQAGLESALVGWRERPGVQVIVASSDRETNVAVHDRLAAAVADALGRA